MNRRFIATVLSASMVFSITACNKVDEPTEPSVDETTVSDSSSELDVKGKGARIAVFETSDIHGYIPVDTSPNGTCLNASEEEAA